MKSDLTELQSKPAVHVSSVTKDMDRAFDLCLRKTRRNIKLLADDPKAAAWAVDGNYFAHPEKFNDIGNWTSSFLTGMALIAWRHTGDEFILQQLLRLMPAYREKAFNPECHSHHDMGFLYSLYSVALFKLTGDREHREVGLQAAEALAMRFNPRGNFIRAWGKLGTKEHENMAIIDCMMNLPLLFWAAQESGDNRFRDIAVHSADTTLKCFIRPDDSVYHAYRFDLSTGAPIGGDNYCGHDIETHWARGTGWAIYGFAIAYRYTGDRKYLDASLRLARKFNRELDGDTIPVWDFRLSAGQTPLRDTSAAAIVACGYQELEKLGVADALITKTKESLLQNLCSEPCLNFDATCPGVLRDGQVGAEVPGSAQNAYVTWGDYYLMEALDRELHRRQTWW
jgi:unsaturated chondroitin disaccharide hydrolase